MASMCVSYRKSERKKTSLKGERKLKKSWKMKNDVKKNVEYFDGATSMKHEEEVHLTIYIWPFSASHQQDNKFSAIHTFISVQMVYSIFSLAISRKMWYNQCWNMKNEASRPTASHPKYKHSHIFRCIWKRKSLLSLYSFTAVEYQLNSDHILCDTLCLWFHSEFVVTFVNVTLYRFKRWNDTCECDIFLLSIFLKNLIISNVGVWRAVLTFHIDWFD